MSTSPDNRPQAGRLVAGLPGCLGEESFETLLRRPGAWIERIVSHGHASPPGFWYDQAWDEWVMLVSGGAAVHIEGEEMARDLRPGDWLLLPAHCRHRVEWTDPMGPSVWLAVHFDRLDPGSP